MKNEKLTKKKKVLLLLSFVLVLFYLSLAICNAAYVLSGKVENIHIGTVAIVTICCFMWASLFFQKDMLPSARFVYCPLCLVLIITFTYFNNSKSVETALLIQNNKAIVADGFLICNPYKIFTIDKIIYLKNHESKYRYEEINDRKLYLVDVVLKYTIDMDDPYFWKKYNTYTPNIYNDIKELIPDLFTEDKEKMQKVIFDILKQKENKSPWRLLSKNDIKIIIKNYRS